MKKAVIFQIKGKIILNKGIFEPKAALEQD
jgi:hypothetical protein